jgi:hypothetical protein
MGSTLQSRLDRYAAELDGQADSLLGDDTPRARPEVMPTAAQPTVMHERLVNLLDHILALGAQHDTGHPMLRTALRTFRKLRPIALEGLAQVPEEEVRQFLGTLTSEILDAVGLDPFAELRQLHTWLADHGAVFAEGEGTIGCAIRYLGQTGLGGDTPDNADSGRPADTDRARECEPPGTGTGVPGGGDSGREVDTR